MRVTIIMLSLIILLPLLVVPILTYFYDQKNPSRK